MAVDLKWLESTGWLKGDKSTVQVPQDVLRQLVEEISEYRGSKPVMAAQDVEAIIDRVSKSLTGSKDELRPSPEKELRWLSRYTLKLMLACLEVLSHLDRLSSTGFVPRVKLERALRGEA